MSTKSFTILHAGGLTLKLTTTLLSSLYLTIGQAAPGILANSPLFLLQQTTPNIFFEVDDSGSMDWEIITKKHWEPCAYDSNYPSMPGNDDCGSGDAAFEGLLRSQSGTVDPNYLFTYSEYSYIFNNPDNIYNFWGFGCPGNWDAPWGFASTPNLESCPDDIKYYEWRARTSDLNVLYYNPAITYMPWKRGDGTSMPDASFTEARSNPSDLQPGYNSLRDLTGFVYEEWIDSHGFSGSRPQRGFNINRTIGANGLVDLWDEHKRYTINASNITIESIKYTTDANGSLTQQSSTSTVTELPGLNGGAAIPLTQVKQNIANWYQYYRRRSFVAKAAIAKVIDDNPGYRYGLNLINNANMFIPVPDAAKPPYTDQNTLIIKSFVDYAWQPVGTPLRGGLNRAGEYFENTDSRTAPIIEACQQNYTILMTDGFWNNPDNLPGKIGDNDGDGIGQTLADVSRYYYVTDLDPLKDDKVTPNAFDSLTTQHMVTYTIAFGPNGLLTDTDNDGWPLSTPGLAENGAWGNPFNSDSGPEKIDDLWHAAYNARGSFIAASSPETISKALQNALANIHERNSSATAVSFNSDTLNSNTLLYQVQFKGLTGDIVSYTYDPISKTFNAKPAWSAAAQLDSLFSPVTNRIILTRSTPLLGLPKGIAFEWANLSLLQKADFVIEPNGSINLDINKAKAKANYLRGDRSNEVGNNGTYDFRMRTSLLGDIINSNPITVGKPKAQWPNAAPFPTGVGQTYTDFSLAQANRIEMLYAGGNDGMLHGFKTLDGSELLAYVPSTLSSFVGATNGLHYLTDPAYSHRYYVDMPSVVEDAYFDTGSGAAWHSLLLGGTRGGGKGIFALDITDPATFSEANAEKIVLWEFDSGDDADMGYSFSVPTIQLLNNNRWAAIFGNGYNNTGDGKAKLFILFLDGGLDGKWTAGADYIELSTDTGSISSHNCADAASDCNGLSTPQTVDLNGDHVIDRVYAGDLKGHLWAFDLSNSDASKWQVAYSGAPLFSAGGPITSRPAVVHHPSQPNGTAPNLLVFFGTGQYLTTDDISNTATQGFYGVWDHGNASLTTANLQEQTFLNIPLFTKNTDGTTTNASTTLRILSDNKVDYAVKHGWFIQFTNGERITNDPVIYEEAVLFNTRIPNSTPCTIGGDGSLMFVPQETGGRATFSLFDANKDKIVSAADLLVDSQGNVYAVSGLMILGKFPDQFSTINDMLVSPNTDTSIDTVPLYVPSKGSMRRISWQEYRKE